MQIFITRGEDSSGPFTLEQIQDYLTQGTLLPDDLAYHEELEDWIPLCELMDSISSSESTHLSSDKPSLLKCGFLSIIWLTVISMPFVFLLVVCPAFAFNFEGTHGKDGDLIPKEPLPSMTESVMNLSNPMQNFIKNNKWLAIGLAVPTGLFASILMGSKRLYLESNICRTIDRVVLFGILLILLLLTIAMFLPLIVLMDKLGS